MRIYLFGGIRISNFVPGMELPRGGYVIEHDEKVWMYDTGMYDWHPVYTNFIKNELGIKKIEGIIISHYHHDHVGGAGQIIADFNGDIGWVASSKVPTTDSKDAVEVSSFYDAVDQYNVNHIQSNSDLLIEESGITFDFLSPVPSVLEGATTSSDQHGDFGTIVKMTYNDFSFMFVGDKFPDYQMLAYQAHQNPEVTALASAHHGDPSYMTSEILEKTKPSLVTMESYPNPFSDQTEEFVRSYGIDVYHLKNQGDMILSVYKGGFNVRPLRELTPFRFANKLIFKEAF